MTADRPTTAAGHGWRHAMWCRWERAESTCSCGLRAYQAEARQPDNEALRLLKRLVESGLDITPTAGLPDPGLGDWSRFSEAWHKARRYLAALPPSDPSA